MADIELVIKIPEEEYRLIKKSDKTVFADVASKECMLHAIKNGTPLPKGHGRLIDADAEIKKIQDISDRVKNRNASCLDVYDGEIAAMRLASTIIEADKEEE